MNKNFRGNVYSFIPLRKKGLSLHKEILLFIGSLCSFETKFAFSEFGGPIWDRTRDLRVISTAL